MGSLHGGYPHRVIYAVVFTLTLFLVAGPRSTAAGNAGMAHVPAVRRHKLRIADPTMAEQVAARGGTLVADYGSFQCFNTDEATAIDFSGRQGVEEVTEQNVIELNTGPLDTRSAEI